MTMNSKDPVAVVLTADTVKWTMSVIGRFPRQHRYGLGSRIESCLIDVLEGLVAAQYAQRHERRRHLDWANTRLQVGKQLFRVAHDLGIVSQKQILHFGRLSLDLGRQVGGWAKSSTTREASSSNS